MTDFSVTIIEVRNITSLFIATILLTACFETELSRSEAESQLKALVHNLSDRLGFERIDTNFSLLGELCPNGIKSKSHLLQLIQQQDERRFSSAKKVRMSKLIEDGLFDYQAETIRLCDGRYPAEFEIILSPNKSVERQLQKCDPYGCNYVALTAELVAVDGIAHQDDRAVVEYTWKVVPTDIGRILGAQYETGVRSGSAEFLRYDSGWRLKSL